MFDIILETIRAIFGAIILLTFVFNKSSKEVKKHNGWFYLVYGFALIFIGMIFAFSIVWDKTDLTFMDIAELNSRSLRISD